MNEEKEIKKLDNNTPIQFEAGILAPRDLSEALRLATMLLKSQLIPKQFDTPEKIVVAMQYCRELNLPCLTGMRQIAVINGSPSLWGDLPLSLAYKSGLLVELEEYVFDRKGTKISIENKNLTDEVYGGYCKGRRKDGKVMESVFTLEDAANADLLGKFGWKKYPKDMLTYRARGRVLKNLVPDALNGISIAEYDYGIHGSEIKGEELKVKAPKINNEAREEILALKEEPILTEQDKEEILKDEKYVIGLPLVR